MHGRVGQGVAGQVWAQEEAEEEGYITTTHFVGWFWVQIPVLAGWEHGVQLMLSTCLILFAVRDGGHII